jgi:hypothetical protein
VNCEAVREQLVERSLGAVRDLAVERHLRTCAACRQEAIGLDRAAALISFAVAPEEPPAELELRVVDTLRDAARRARPAPARRRSVAALLAAVAALAALGGGAVLASRGSAPDPAIVANQQRGDLDQFLKVVEQVGMSDSVAMLGVLSDPSGGTSRGSAMSIVGGRAEDRVLVMANGLEAAADALPLSVRVADGNGHYVWVGSIERLTPTGGFTTARIVDVDLKGYVNVTVRDADGRVLLAGSLAEQASIPSPSG